MDGQCLQLRLAYACCSPGCRVLRELHGWTLWRGHESALSLHWRQGEVSLWMSTKHTSEHTLKFWQSMIARLHISHGYERVNLEPSSKLKHYASRIRQPQHGLDYEEHRRSGLRPSTADAFSFHQSQMQMLPAEYIRAHMSDSWGQVPSQSASWMQGRTAQRSWSTNGQGNSQNILHNLDGRHTADVFEQEWAGRSTARLGPQHYHQRQALPGRMC